MRRKLIELIQDKPLNKDFELALQQGIVRYNNRGGQRIPSPYYTPSSLVCQRQMYYRRSGVQQEEDTADYNSIEMAETGTARHEAIQRVLLYMSTLKDSDWEYVDVGEYVKRRNLPLEVLEQHGAETHLRDNVNHLSFMVDGLLYHRTTGEYVLFEFKNVISFKWNKVQKTKKVLPDHHNQVITYCKVLGLNKAFVVYENRDTCALLVPETFEVTEQMKDELFYHINETEAYFEADKIPPMYNGNLDPCKYCRYKKRCWEDR